MTNWLTKAKAFVEDRFRDARLKKDPVAHAFEVYRILREEFRQEDADILIAGILHDVLEDTKTTTEQDLGKHFSPHIASLVKEVSHDRERHYDREAFYEHLKTISPEAKWIKLADLYANLEWMLQRIQEGNPVFHSHKPFLRHVEMFLDSCVQPAFATAKQQLTKHCKEIDRLENEYVYREEFSTPAEI
jgi:(p)ppGpp synthase/HD superfamily hydrolase